VRCLYEYFKLIHSIFFLLFPPHLACVEIYEGDEENGQSEARFLYGENTSIKITGKEYPMFQLANCREGEPISGVRLFSKEMITCLTFINRDIQYTKTPILSKFSEVTRQALENDTFFYI
jgi:hypothetical protein